MDCNKVNTLIKEWEDTGSMDKTVYNAISLHIASCERCAGKYQYLLPLLKRDANLGPINVDVPDKKIEMLEKSILKKIKDKKINIHSTNRWKRVILLAAAIFIFGMISFVILPKYSRSKDEIIVTFRLTAPEAKSVALVGDFTNWEPSKLILKNQDKDGTWEIKIKLKKGRVYTYNFLIDGEKWITDPNSLLRVKDGFGGESSYIKL